MSEFTPATWRSDVLAFLKANGAPVIPPHGANGIVFMWSVDGREVKFELRHHVDHEPTSKSGTEVLIVLSMFAWQLLPTDANDALVGLVSEHLEKRKREFGYLTHDWQIEDENVPSMWSQDEIMMFEHAPWPTTFERALRRLTTIFSVLGPFVAEAREGRVDPKKTKTALVGLRRELEKL